MKNALYVDFVKGNIVMTSTFAKKCYNTSSEEYSHLQDVRRDYPNFAVITRHIKKNPHKKIYKGLTYDFMREYIVNNSTEEEAAKLIETFESKIEISKCHGAAYKYPVIKKWFFEQFPEIPDFGTEETEEKEAV